jgi:hypothetical protein
MDIYHLPFNFKSNIYDLKMKNLFVNIFKVLLLVAFLKFVYSIDYLKKMRGADCNPKGSPCTGEECCDILTCQNMTSLFNTTKIFKVCWEKPAEKVETSEEENQGSENGSSSSSSDSTNNEESEGSSKRDL